MTLGAIRASPTAAACTAWASMAVPAVLEQEAAGAGAQRGVDVLVQVEGRDDHDGDRVRHLGSGQRAGGLDAVEAGHPDVEEAHVGAQVPGQFDGAVPVGGLADDLDVRLRVEDHRESGADDLLIVGDHHPHGHVAPPARGSTAVTVQPRPSGGAGLAGAAEQAGAFCHADQPVPRSGRGATAGLAVVAHL
nr:hypothetical protein GCM10020092_024090 [Actinoplanes digitatis]